MKLQDQAMRQGALVLEVTGKLPCTIMCEHAEMIGYLTGWAKEYQEAAEFLKKMQSKPLDTERFK